MITEGFNHCKAIAASGAGIDLFSSGDLTKFSQVFVDAIMQHRHWMRTQKEMIPA